jgi:hypothetical protein
MVISVLSVVSKTSSDTGIYLLDEEKFEEEEEEEEGQTIQWPKEKRQTTIYKTLHRKLKIEQHEYTKIGGLHMYSGRLNSSCSKCVLIPIFCGFVLLDL